MRCREILFAWSKLWYPWCCRAEVFYSEVFNLVLIWKRLLLENRDVDISIGVWLVNPPASREAMSPSNLDRKRQQHLGMDVLDETAVFSHKGFKFMFIDYHERNYKLKGLIVENFGWIRQVIEIRRKPRVVWTRSLTYIVRRLPAYPGSEFRRTLVCTKKKSLLGIIKWMMN